MADTLGVSRSTIYRWLKRDDRPESTFGKIGDKFTRMERWYYNERPQRVAAKPGIFPGTLEGGLGRNLLSRARYGFDFKPSRAASTFGSPAILEAIRRGRPLTFQIVTQRTEFGSRELVDAKIPTKGLSLQQVDTAYFRALRYALKQAGGGADAYRAQSDYEAVDVQLEAVFVDA